MKFKIDIFKHYDNHKLEAIYASTRKTLRQTYRVKEDAVFEVLNPLEERIVVVKHNDEEVAATRLHYYEDRLHVIGLGVLDTYRGQGICRLIVDHIKREAIRIQKKQISLYTIRETGNVEVFSKLGFVVMNDEITDDFFSDTYETLHEVYMVFEVEEVEDAENI